MLLVFSVVLLRTLGCLVWTLLGIIFFLRSLHSTLRYPTVYSKFSYSKFSYSKFSYSKFSSHRAQVTAYIVRNCMPLVQPRPASASLRAKTVKTTKELCPIHQRDTWDPPCTYDPPRHWPACKQTFRTTVLERLESYDEPGQLLLSVPVLPVVRYLGLLEAPAGCRSR